MTSTIVLSTTSASSDVAIPQMTLEPGCLNDLYRLTTRCGLEQTLCTFFHLGSRNGQDGCLPESPYPATTCPKSYTSAGSNNLVDNAKIISVELYCCPRWATPNPTPRLSTRIMTNMFSTADTASRGKTHLPAQHPPAPRASLCSRPASQHNPTFPGAAVRPGP